jgi:polyisoprenoid-binding protein YceI
MPRGIRRLLIVLVVLVAGGLAAGFAVFAIRGSDAPPPPELSAPAAEEEEGDAAATGTPAPAGAADWAVVSGAPTFVGYRVREEFASIGVVDAVGRTGEVTGALRVDGDTVESGALETDMSSLRSDEGRRDNALRGRGIETDRFPTAGFELTEPFELSRRAVAARGRLTLHGETQPVVARVKGQRTGDDAIELVGSVPIDFDRFAKAPPSVAGFVTVRDTGTLEFDLRLKPR